MMHTLPSDQNASGRSFGSNELDNLRKVIESGTLFAPKGRFVKDLESRFSQLMNGSATVACSSGTAAIHAAIAGIDPEPGDEIITTPITDMGAIAPILYQGAIPVFADVNPDTGNVSAQSVSERLSDRTKAVIVTHLFGNPADVEAIAHSAKQHGVALIEDCAQAFGATLSDRRVGEYGAVATFSLQQGKHITTGEGGLIAVHDESLYRRIRLFINKAWDYDGPSDHEFLALNYRMSELEGAVGLAQLSKLTHSVSLRIAMARRLDEGLSDVPGVRPIPVLDVATNSYWRYGLIVEDGQVPGGPDQLAAKLREFGLPSGPRYVKKPAFQTALFRDQRTFGESRWPFTLARPEAVDYSESRFPGTFDFLRRVLVLPWNERLEGSHVSAMAEAIRTSVLSLREEAA